MSSDYRRSLSRASSSSRSGFSGFPPGRGLSRSGSSIATSRSGFSGLPPGRVLSRSGSIASRSFSRTPPPSLSGSGSGYGSGRPPFMRAASISNESRPAGRPVPMIAPPSNSGTGFSGPRRASNYPLPLGNLRNGGYGDKIDRKGQQAGLMQQRAEYYANLAQAYAAKAEIGGPFAFVYAMKARQFDRRHRLADRFARQHEARRMLLDARLKRHIWQQQKGAFKEKYGPGRSRPISKLRFKLGW